MYILLLIILCDTRELSETMNVDVIELNHVYNTYGEAGLDQIVLWNWCEYTDENNKKSIQKKPLGFIVLDRDLHREQLTPEEWAEKNREFQQAWDKKFGANNYRPKYNPDFINTMYCPYYDQYRKVWCVLLKRGQNIIRVYGISYTESWTQYDPEIEARKLWKEYNDYPKKRLDMR